MAGEVEDVHPVDAVDRHRATWFAPERPVGGTVYERHESDAEHGDLDADV